MLQTKMDNLENALRRDSQNKETHTCYNGDKPGHLSKDCRKTKDSNKTETSTSNFNQTSQSETKPFNVIGSGQQA